MTNDSDSIATLRLLAKCGSMDLSMLGPIADEITQLRGNLSLAEDGLANYALEVERLQKRLDRINEKWPHVTEVERLRDALKRVRRVAAEGTTHTGMIAALGILVDRVLNPGNGPLPPDYTYHSHEPSEQRIPVHVDATGKTREPPHCPSCSCGVCGCPDEYCLKLAGSLKPGIRCADDCKPVSQGASRDASSDDRVTIECPQCFGDKRISMSDGSSRRCEYCSGTGRAILKLEAGQ
jgi:hypothetical protein